jgi:hypothetical protein
MTIRVTFSDVLRNRPLVLTQHEVWSLSRVVGRDVLPELQAICGERYEVMTMGQLMRTLTAMLSSRRQHIGGADCWCTPTVEFKDPISGSAVWVHNQVQ